MALDKIFIHRRDISFSEVREDSSDIEFIRKDALLEFVEKYKKTPLPGKTVIAYLIEQLDSM